MLLPCISFFLSSLSFSSLGSVTLGRRERETLAVPSHLLPCVSLFSVLVSCCPLRLGGGCRAVPIVFLLCSVAVLAFLPHVSHPAFSSCLSAALILDAVAVSGGFPCFILSV